MGSKLCSFWALPEIMLKGNCQRFIAKTLETLEVQMKRELLSKYSLDLLPSMSSLSIGDNSSNEEGIYDCHIPVDDWLKENKNATVAKLYDACFLDEFPKELLTLHDYGFLCCLTPEDQSMLLGVYQSLFRDLEIHPAKVHGWLKKGILADKIHEVICTVNHRGEYFEWFLLNKDLLNSELF